MLTMFMPAFNEEKIIRRNAVLVSRELRRVQDELGVRVKFVVLDDGSTDGTRRQVELAQQDDPAISYQHTDGPSRRENLVKAMLAADTEYVGWLDADLATSLNHVEPLIAVCQYFDIVSGSRYVPSAHAARTPSRRLISVSYNRCVRLLFGSRVRDHWCGFKVFRQACLQSITKEIGIGVTTRRMFWDAQMWVAAQQLDYRVLEIPVNWLEGEKSALRFGTELSMIPYTLRYWLTGPWRSIGSGEQPMKTSARPTRAPR